MLRLIKSNLAQITGRRWMSGAVVNSLPTPQSSPEILCTGIFINNEWHKSVSGKMFPVINPATGETIAEVQEGDKVHDF